MRRVAAVLIAVSLLLPAASAAENPLGRAELLHRVAREHLDEGSVEARQLCVRDLEEAIRLDPQGRTGDHWLLLGQVKERGGFDAEAAQCYERAAATDTTLPDPFTFLGRVRKRQWLRTLDPALLLSAVAALDSATARRPGDSEPWLLECPLLYELPDLPRALAAAERAVRGHPRMVESPLAVAMMAWRTGDAERADSLFAATIPHLAPELYAMFEHPQRYIGAVAARARRVEQDSTLDETLEADDSLALALAVPAGVEPLPDPDPTTPENELMLEYWSRVTHAYLLFTDPLRPGLDARGETYVRYGPPASVRMNPAGMALYFKPDVSASGHSRSLAEYPLDAQVWDYPALGMHLILHDRSLSGHYTQPALRNPYQGMAPDPALLARRPDLFGTDGSLAVFPTLPPGSQRIEVGASIARFQGASGPRLVAFIQAPAESLTARWLVRDAAGRQRLRGTAALRPSVCDPAAMSATVVSADLPPGEYELDVSVRDRRGHRGVQRVHATLERAGSLLAASDIVLCCGEPTLFVSDSTIRLESNIGGVVRGGAPAVAYFEIYHLAAGPDGISRCTVDHVVERLRAPVAGRAGRGGATETRVSAWTSREEKFRRPVHRKFVSVPTSTLPPGTYRFTVTVHDALTGASVSRSTTFDRQ